MAVSAASRRRLGGGNVGSWYSGGPPQGGCGATSGYQNYLAVDDDNSDDEFDTLEKYFGDYDFLFLHIKGTDSAGEDGDFSRKVSVIEHLDMAMVRLLNLYPDVIVVTGDQDLLGLPEGPTHYHTFQGALPLFQRSSSTCLSRSESIGCQNPICL